MSPHLPVAVHNFDWARQYRRKSHQIKQTLRQFPKQKRNNKIILFPTKFSSIALIAFTCFACLSVSEKTREAIQRTTDKIICKKNWGLFVMSGDRCVVREAPSLTNIGLMRGWAAKRLVRRWGRRVCEQVARDDVSTRRNQWNWMLNVLWKYIFFITAFSG